VDSELDLQLERVNDVVVIGQGNAAVDICRILARSHESLRNAPVGQKFMNQIRKSNIKNISMVGRRGLGQVQFTTAEIREITSKIVEIDSFICKNEIIHSLGGLTKEELLNRLRPAESRVKEKIFKLIEGCPDLHEYLINP